MLSYNKIDLFTDEKILLEIDKVKYKGKVVQISEGYQRTDARDNSIWYNNELTITNKRIILKRKWIVLLIIDFSNRTSNSNFSTFKDFNYCLSKKEDISVIVDENGERYLQVIGQNAVWNSKQLRYGFYFKDVNVVLRLVELFGEKLLDFDASS